jgi:hypothetical protein
MLPNMLKLLKQPDNNFKKNLKVGNQKVPKLEKAIDKHGNMMLKTSTLNQSDQDTQEASSSPTLLKLLNTGEMLSKLTKILDMKLLEISKNIKLPLLQQKLF